MRGLRRFLCGREGSINVTFGLLAVPLVGVIAALTDYSRAASDRTRIQQIVDATAITLAKRAQALNQAEMQTLGDSLVRTQLASRDLTVDSVTVAKGTTAITVDVRASVPAKFGGILGAATVALSAYAQVAWGSRKIEVALVLDNTGSMGSSGKIEALRTAVTNLVTTLQGVMTEPGSVKISLVPFDTGVKVGTSHASASWLTKSYMESWQQPHWNGCVMDRDTSYDVNDDEPVSTSLTTLYPARMCPNAALAEIMPMTSDFDALRARVQQMQPSGNTNVTVGVAWGLASLSPYEPLGGALPFGTADLEKFMIVLTDGDNTQNRWTTWGSWIDGRTQLACAAVKAKNVKVYAVRVINGNATLLQNCATSPSMYYNVTEAAQLDPVFREIANSIRALRLTQ